MPLSEKVNSDITGAMKSKDAGRLSALRMLKAALMNKGIEKGRDLEDAEVYLDELERLEEAGDVADFGVP